MAILDFTVRAHIGRSTHRSAIAQTPTLRAVINSRIHMGFHSAPSDHLALADHLTLHMQI